MPLARSIKKITPLLALKWTNPVNKIPEVALPLNEAVHLTRSLAVGHKDRKIALNIQFKITDPSTRELRGIVVLPHSFSENKTLVFAEGEEAKKAKEAGAHIVGGEEIIQKVVDNELEFDRVICTPDMLRIITKPLARILGPRGVMPTEKKGTVTEDIVTALKSQSDAVVFKTDNNAFISTIIGKVGLKHEQLQENISTFVSNLKDIKKGKNDDFIEEMYIQAEKMPQILLKV